MSQGNYNKNATDRVDARAKVTGAAKYAADYAVPGTVHGVLVGSTIAHGRIATISTGKAEAAPGVLAVFTHLNMPKLPGYEKDASPSGHKLFHSDRIFFNGQAIALVVADTLERARHAASLIAATYEMHAAELRFDPAADRAKTPQGEQYLRGEADAWQSAPVRLQHEYGLPTEVHSPIETHSTTAVWESADRLTVYDKTHAVKDVQQELADVFGLPRENVLIRADLVGGGFGCGLRLWPHSVAAAVAARQLGRPVKLTLSRPQMFRLAGYRPQTWQRIGLGATADGRLVGIRHEAVGQTSVYEDFTEGTVGLSRVLYACPNVETVYKILPMHVSTPTWMRAPGEATGSFALESALDELAYALDLDPLELRLRNFAEKDPDSGKPWSSNALKACYQTASARFGWEKRPRKPRSMPNGDWLTGYGMATGAWLAMRLSATARGRLTADGMLLLQSATSDMGPGTATVMTRIAAEALGIAPEKVRFEMGRSDLPDSPCQGGSFTTASVGSAVYDVCKALQQKLAELAVGHNSSPLHGLPAEALVFENGAVSSAKNPGSSLSYGELLRLANLPELDITQKSRGPKERDQYSLFSFAAHFVEVQVHALTGVTRVTRCVSAVDGGKILSPKTAASQVSGAIAGGIGMALMEELIADPRDGRIVNGDFAGYHVAVNADVPPVEVFFTGEPDPVINPMGSKGIGEVGLIGVAAAIANAVFHATGKRVRELPITLDKLI